MRKGDDIRDRTFRFGCDVVRVCDVVAERGFSARQLARQLAASGTAVGALLEEADGAQSRADFISKCTISLKEARETHYWLRVMHATGKLDEPGISDECNQIIAILTTIVRKSRGE